MLNQCSVLLLSAAASAGSPAYVSGLLENNTTDACTGWLEDSVNGGAWTDVSPQLTLPATKQGLLDYPWAKTGNYYAGPGTSVRACVLTPGHPDVSGRAPVLQHVRSRSPAARRRPQTTARRSSTTTTPRK